MLTLMAASQTSTSNLIGIAGLVVALVGLPVAVVLGQRVRIQAKDATSQKTLEERLDELSKSMRDSARLVEQVSAELDAQATTAKRLKEEAETAQALASLHKEQAEAVRRLIDAELATTARRIRSDSIRIAIVSFIVGVGATVGVTLLVPLLH